MQRSPQRSSARAHVERGERQFAVTDTKYGAQTRPIGLAVCDDPIRHKVSDCVTMKIARLATIIGILLVLASLANGSVSYLKRVGWLEQILIPNLWRLIALARKASCASVCESRCLSNYLRVP